MLIHNLNHTLDLTIVIPCKNSGEKLRKCLNQIGQTFAAKIVVIESEKSILSESVCHEFGAELIVFNWNGLYPKKRNWFLINHTPITKWVLFIDDDEMLTEKAKNEIKKAINSDYFKGYWLKYKICVGSKKLSFGYPLYKLALFQTQNGLFEKIDENHWSNLDMEIHEHPIIDGPIGKLKTNIEHQINLGNQDWKIKHEKYARWEAKRYLNLSENDKQQLSKFQTIKYKVIQTPFAGVVFFIGSYFYMGGILDGLVGFKYSWLKASYFQQIYIYIKQKNYN